MPGKSHGGHRHTAARRKKGKIKRDIQVIDAPQQQAVAQDDSPVSRVPLEVSRMSKPRASSSNTMQHAYISNELRRIAVLAGVMLVILVVLYLVVP